jgi:putative ABC transport system substrate-binding protein
MAGRHGIPATYSSREYIEAGGFMSYGTNLPTPIVRWALRGPNSQGCKPADPVIQSTKFEFVINLQTARTTWSRRAILLQLPPTR